MPDLLRFVHPTPLRYGALRGPLRYGMLRDLQAGRAPAFRSAREGLSSLKTLLYNENMAGQSSLQKIMDILRRQLPTLESDYSVATLELFGSYVRHEQRTDSDLDILVTFTKTPSLLKFIRLENFLSDILGVKVDLVMKDSLKPGIGRSILREAVPV